jgi:integrase
MIATSRTAMSEAFHIVARLDPITILIATGLRRSELPALRWDDYDDGAGTVAVTGKVVRVAGKGPMRIDKTKTAAGRRTIPLRRFAVETLTARRGQPYLGRHLRNRQPVTDDGQHGLIPLPGHGQLPHPGSVKHQPKHCQVSTEAEMSRISQGHTSVSVIYGR